MPPPRGRGLYVRDDDRTFSAALATCQWVALHKGAKLAERARVCRERGIPFWVYSLVEHWRDWRDEPSTLAQIARAHGAQGIIADPEPDRAHPMGSEEALELGRALRAVAESGLDVGVTSFPTVGIVDELGEACGDKVWGSPQCYFKNTAWGSRFAIIPRWVDRWQAAGFSTVIPSVSVWHCTGPPDHCRDIPNTPEVWKAYFDSIPPARAAIGWPLTGPAGHIRAAWEKYHPSPLPVEADKLVGAVERATGLSIEALAAILAGCATVLIAVLIYFGGVA